jgi:hypothetical protein
MNPYSNDALRKIYDRNFNDDQIVYIARLGVKLPVYSDLTRPETMTSWINDGDIMVSEEAHYSILKILQNELKHGNDCIEIKDGDENISDNER